MLWLVEPRRESEPSTLACSAPTLAPMNPMKFVQSVCSELRLILTAAALLCGLEFAAMADVPKSLLPAFGNEGAEFTTKAQGSHVTKGWLPNEWKDNTEWAAVSATYTKLADSPDKDAGAVRIKVEKVDEGQLQLTTYGGIQKYKKGTRYLVTGWVRSAGGLSVNLGVRQMAEPYEFYHEQEVTTGPEWKKFEFAFTPTMDISAFLMFVVREVGSVDVAGIAVKERP